VKLLFCNSYEDEKNHAIVRAFEPDDRGPVIFEFVINGKKIELSTTEAKIFRSLMSKEPQ
jgi:hypothetical protein